MEGGLNSMEFDVSVPSRDLLGVSGFIIDWSPEPPNIMLDRDAGVLHLAANALRAPPPCKKQTI